MHSGILKEFHSSFSLLQELTPGKPNWSLMEDAHDNLDFNNPSIIEIIRKLLWSSPIACKQTPRLRLEKSFKYT
jgi:hypothetical protein